MVDVKQTITSMEEQQGRKFTEQEHKVLEGIGEMLNGLWKNKDNDDLRTVQHDSFNGKKVDL